MKYLKQFKWVMLFALSSFLLACQPVEWDEYHTPSMLMSGVWDWEAENSQVYFKPYYATDPNGEVFLNEELVATYSYDHPIKTFIIQDQPGFNSGLNGYWTVLDVFSTYENGKIVDGEFLIQSQINPTTLITFTR